MLYLGCDLGRNLVALVPLLGTTGAFDLDIQCNISGACRLYREERLA